MFAQFFHHSPLSPLYWHWWLIIAILWFITRLPLPWQLIIGRQIGYCLYLLASRRRHIATININLCFPERSDSERLTLVKESFFVLGEGLLELLSAWWMPTNRLKVQWHVIGEEHVIKALERNKGIILLSAHFTALEMGGRYVTTRFPKQIHAIYRHHRNPVLEYVTHYSREKHAEKAIRRDAVREMLRSLKANKILWLATDQNFGHKNSVFANFFGIPTATNTVVSRLAGFSDSVIIPFFTQRLPNQQGYKIIYLPPLDNFPSGDYLTDTNRLNKIIENQIREVPEQYLWTHRRFKDRPAGEKSFYDA
ncbi:LpxL/LpxP family Kdo(2)-lipid IV(A) lauroyl/palmitoleoyl acyltransferase [Beggiatoa leptomitoformis]|uniref:Lipid A biosynthesis acyltransferase n=1 Tax=Beggiatoa leptomitoformis TaxID=288004 RepID=A0A2N9YHW1_9GAMM|nr:LpxL/LpxP family Kdo(2)-lipid IV(A) lauroyl/palmitoleoyl acyltransferase [Beggiatoa leptomitoformis]ALG67709.1 LpxL/LpxP family Kdo(2)-lipid IV(A) lauroyl/palmitoleoyl acyltransferase [Beggiatoa leptomitoformis]AUI70053.1 LpxL/LpxP family Kdo(2)-lipid IV(A) lauroyl/palmitoleoyl acyltransferase [Beggiatoa leptomitoformis]